MPRTWFTSDLHFGHANIIQYSHRPYPSVAAMNDALVARWNEVVAPEDEVWVLGDVAMGAVRTSLEYVRALNGHKHLVAGNHDRCWAGLGPKAREWRAAYTDVGFETLASGVVERTLGAHTVAMCHFPYTGDSHAEERFERWRPRDDGRFLLHGHVHTQWRQRGRMINVGVDAWGLRPVSEAEVGALIDAGPGESEAVGV
jgi:calcineurin-like phosphoesterase family protein